MKVSSPAPAGAPVRHELVNQSVFMGNISGAPRAMAGLLTFFLESTFIGLWLFGRNRMPPLVHTISVCVTGRLER
jgi:cytochrome bd-type quinol oxidase subunit 1